MSNIQTPIFQMYVSRDQTFNLDLINIIRYQDVRHSNIVYYSIPQEDTTTVLLFSSLIYCCFSVSFNILLDVECRKPSFWQAIHCKM